MTSTSKVRKDAHLWARHPEDWYVEPEWCPKRLIEVEPFDGTVWDPACGMGVIVSAFRDAGITVLGSDLVARRPGKPGHLGWTVDFLGVDLPLMRVANIVSNPPFKIADAFVRQALALATGKVAMLLPVKWLSSNKRAAWLKTTPLRRVYFLTPRPSMPPGPVIEAGIKPGNGTADFCWVVWLQGYDCEPEFQWLQRDGA